VKLSATRTRRYLLQTSLATLAVSAVARPAAAASSRLFVTARAALDRLGGAIPEQDVVGLADFSAPSRERRFYLLNMGDGRMDNLLVAHGRGSDPSHSGWLRRFSNEPGSAATSEGAYRTDALYTGKHGRSMRLEGLDVSNDNAAGRAIVVHSAWYVSAEVARTHGALGRSEGCFAFDSADLDGVLARLGPGRLILAGRY
jgi:hypothetical protein